MAAIRVGMIADLWRYPVKSFGGQRTRHVFLGPYGLQGDRCHAVISPGGALVTARRSGGLLGFSAGFDDAEASTGVTVTTPAGRTHSIDDPALNDAVTEVVGRDAMLAQAPAGVFDCAPVHITTDSSLERLGQWVGDELEVRRFRPNIVVALDDGAPFAEAGWVDRTVTFGDGPAVRVVSPTERCAVPTIDPDTLERNNEILKTIVDRRENLFGIYAEVLRPGWLRVGDPVAIGDPPEPAGAGPPPPAG